MQRIAVTALQPNPYRHIERYTISEEKIVALEQSYQNSGFWDGSIQVRPHPTKDGKYQLAFGHHRLEAARRQKLETIGVVVSARSNADMLRMMADENRAEFKHDALVGVETIAAVVEAFGKDEVELEAVAADGPRAGNVILPSGKIYNLATVARFLGWVKPSDGPATAGCRAAFDAFRERASTEEALRTLAPEERSEVAVKTVVAAAKAARVAAKTAGLTPAKVREAERRAAGSAAREVKDTSGFRAIGQAVQIGKSAAASVAGPKSKAQPPVELYISKLIAQFETADPYGPILVACRRLVPFIDDLDAEQTRRLVKALRGMLQRSTLGVQNLITALETRNKNRVRALLAPGE